MNTKTIYLFHHETGEYIGTYEAQESPQEPESYIEPTYSTALAPPDVLLGHVAVFNAGGWLIVEDHRGATVYDQATGAAMQVSTIGPVPSGYGLIPPASTLLAQAKAAKMAEIEFAAETAIAPITLVYPLAERDTWPIQEAEAMAWTANSSAPTPMLNAIADARGQTIAAVAANVLTRASAFKALAGATFGKRKAKRDLIDAATTAAELSAIVW